MSLIRIGDLARLGGVSVRMLRHYHEVGLLVPDSVDPVTGYRSYTADQLAALHRIVALKGLGLPLAAIAEIVSPACPPERLTEVLAARRAEIVREIASAHDTLGRLDARLQQLAVHRRPNEEYTMSTTDHGEIDVEVKSVAARLVAQRAAVAESWAPEDIGPVIQGLYPDLLERMARAGVTVTGPSTAWYDDTEDGRIRVHATFGIDEPPAVDAGEYGFEITVLPAIERVASTVHRGTNTNLDRTDEALLSWIEANGHRAVGYSREIDVECENPDERWVVELQLELER
jgi:DNA-binding transcriptional MerR regulator